MTTLADQLKTSIEGWVEDVRRESGLAALARAGMLTPRAVGLYLESLRHILQNSQLNLQLAARTSKAAGLTELAEYFEIKAREEKGHDTWASNDLSRLPLAVSDGLKPLPASLRLVELQRTLIAEHPVCFVVYTLWSEYSTVLLGDEWLDMLEKCGFPRDQVSAIANHLEADREHAARGLSEIDRLWMGQPDRFTMLRVLERASRIFDEVCDEICSEARRAA